MKRENNYRIKIVDNVLDILETISDLKEEVTLSVLCNKLKISKNALFRILKTLEIRGYLEPSLISGKYFIGSSAFKTSRKFLLQMDLQRIARQQMERLVSECNESVYLALLMDNEVILFDAVMSTQRVQVMSLVGKHYQQDELSAGKIFLAYSSHKNITSELIQIRADGLCIDHHLLDEGVSSVSVPVFNSGNNVLACLCLVGPTFRLQDNVILNVLLPRIKSASQMISIKLGHAHEECDDCTYNSQNKEGSKNSKFSDSMLIGEFSKSLGVTPRAIRLYEAMGLIDPPARSEGGRRFYDEGDFKRFKYILAIKDLGFSLLEIQKFVNVHDNNAADNDELSPLSHGILDALTSSIKQKIASLNSLQGNIEDYMKKQIVMSSSFQFSPTSATLDGEGVEKSVGYLKLR